VSIIDGISVPPSWTVRPFGRVAARIQLAGQPNLEPLSVFLDEGVVPRSSRQDNHNQLGEDLAKYLIVQPGDIVFNKLRTWQGGLGVSRYEGIVSPAYFVCRPKSEYDPRYLHYLLHSQPYLQELTRISKWMPPSQFDIGWEQLRLLPVFAPPRAVQARIADYLDSTTTRIDALIAKKRRMIDLLEERVNAQVSDYIRRSPLAGEGEVEVVPIRRVLTKLERWADGGNMVTAFRDGEVTTREARNREGFTNAWTETARVQQVEVGDVVIHGLDGFSGAIGDARTAGVCSPVYHVCIPKQGDGTFYGRMLRLLAVNGYLGNFAISTRERAVDFRNWDLFGRIPVPLVPTDEQRAIGDEIRKIRPLRDRIVASEALALEHRQALITAAVTGKLEIPVPEAVA